MSMDVSMHESASANESARQQTEQGIHQVHLSLPQQLLLTFLKQLSILMAGVTIIYLPLFVGLAMINESIGGPEGFRSRLLYWTWYRLIANVDAIHNDENTMQGNHSPEDMFVFGKEMRISECLDMVYYFDLAVQIIIILGILIIEHSLHCLRAAAKPLHIQSYSLQVSQLPAVPAYILIPAMNKLLNEELYKQYELLLEGKSVFDIECSITQEFKLIYQIKDELQREKEGLKISKIKSDEIKDEIEQQQEQPESNRQINQEELTSSKLIALTLKLAQSLILSPQQETHPVPAALFLTFQTRLERNLALKLFKNNHWLLSKCFPAKCLLTKEVRVEKAPNPSQINWDNFNSSKLNRYFFRAFTLALSVALILGVNAMMIFGLPKIPSIIFKPILSLLLQITFHILLQKMSFFEKHTLKSREDLGLARKMTFVMCFAVGVSMTVGQASFGSREWFQNAGVDILVIMVVQGIYKNIRLHVQFYRDWIFGLLQYWFEHRRQPFSATLHQYKSIFSKQTLQLSTASAHLLSYLLPLIFLTITHPIFYPLIAATACAFSFSHRRFIKFYCKRGKYGCAKIVEMAIKSVYLVIGGRLVAAGLMRGTKDLTIILIALIFIGMIIIRSLLIDNLFKLGKRVLGHMLFWPSSDQCQSAACSLTSRLSLSQIRLKTQQLQRRLSSLPPPPQTPSHLQFYDQYKKMIEGWVERMYEIQQARQSERMRGRISYWDAQSDKK